MRMKKHIADGKLLVAACDSALAGNVFEEGDIVLSLSESFYGKKETEKKEFLDSVKQAYMLNCAGKETISLLLEPGIAAKEDIKTICGIPYVNLVFEIK